MTAALLLSLALAAGAPNAPTCIAPDGSTIALELAETDQERALGLMFRDSLDEDRGMLFLFSFEAMHGFWMKNTFIPLDMIWLSPTGEVLQVRANVPPCRLDPCPSYEPSKPARAVLELAAGAAARRKIVPGSRLRFSGVPGYPVAEGAK